ncbi:tetratricopeptide repeat protein [Streptomyces sp. NBC_00433]
MAGSYHQLGNVAQGRGQLDEAEDWHRQSLTIKEDLGNRPGMASSYHQLGMVAQDREQWEVAEGWYRQSLTIEEDLGNRPGLAISYAQLGLHAQAQQRSAQALTWVVKCVSLFDAIPHPSTGSGPAHLRLLTAELGIEAVEGAWQATTGSPLPAAVREYVLTEPTAD